MYKVPLHSITTAYGFLMHGAVSPPTDHITGDQWWTDYQPVSYELTSKRGTPAEFASMVSMCAAAGVGVIAGTFRPSQE